MGSRNLEYPWIFNVLRTERKMERHLAKVSEEEIVAINEAEVKSGGYIPRRHASQYISTTIHLPFGGQFYIIQ